MKKACDRILAVFFAFILLTFGVLIYFIPRESFSEEENRSLADFPEFSLKSIVSSEFFRGLGTFYSDHFPFRRAFTEIKCGVELLGGRLENNGVIVAREGYLVVRPKYDDLSLFEKNLASIETFCYKQSENGLDTAVFFAPRAIDVLENYLPKGYPISQEEEIWKMIESSDMDIISATEKLKKGIYNGEYLWYKTDHHWTAKGAYECYKLLCERFDKDAMNDRAFEIQILSKEFSGTTASRFGADAPSSDEFFIMRYENDQEFFVVNYDTEKVKNGFYNYEYVDEKDKYSVFFGGNHGHMGIYREEDGSRDSLMVIKDSFANSVIPFLALDYDLEVYDLRYFKGVLSEEIENIDPSRVLILCGIDTLVTDSSFKYINR